MSPGDRLQVTGDSWEGDGKMCRRKENLFSFHLACTIFPTVIFVFHGEDVGFMGAKALIFCFHLLSEIWGVLYSTKSFFSYELKQTTWFYSSSPCQSPLNNISVRDYSESRDESWPPYLPQSAD